MDIGTKNQFSIVSLYSSQDLETNSNNYVSSIAVLLGKSCATGKDDFRPDHRESTAFVTISSAFGRSEIFSACYIGD